MDMRRHTRVVTHAHHTQAQEALGREAWTCAHSHTVTYTQAAGTCQQGGGTPVPEGKAASVLPRGGFLSPAQGPATVNNYHHQATGAAGPNAARHLPRGAWQRGGDRQPCCRLAPALTPRRLVFNDDTVSQRRTAPGLSGALLEGRLRPHSSQTHSSNTSRQFL